EGMKKALMGKYGGNPNSERAVQQALAWLVKQQNPTTGAWNLRGPYPNGGSYDSTAAATAMALLAFQGNGITHQKGAYKENVRKGWDYLLSVQSRNSGVDEGLFYMDDGGHTHRYYSHGQGLIAVCELYAMTRDPKFRIPAENAVKAALAAQSTYGGWRYQPKADSDTSVTGWFVMGLTSARMGGLAVPEDVFDRMRDYLDKSGQDGGAQYGYQPGQSQTNVMTAEGLLCRQYLGWQQNDPRLLRGADYLLGEHMPNNGKKDVYYWYYATQMFHHLEGDRWDRWNGVMRDQLINSQTGSGNDAGSWSPAGFEWADHGGRLYVTCMCTFMLEVYYRHLPLYSGISL
ncbi:MAG TPA: squalene--hopene cyclase, partial [Pirellulales bacterium]